MAETYSNKAQSTTSATVTAGATTIPVNSTAAYPQTGNFRVVIDSEILIVEVASLTGLFVVARGAEGTTAASHARNSKVTGVLTKGALDAIRAEDLATAAADATSKANAAQAAAEAASDPAGSAAAAQAASDPVGSAAAAQAAAEAASVAKASLGAGVETFLGTPTGENLASALTTALTTAKGGTGLTALGSAGQVLRVASGGTALEFGDDVVGGSGASGRAYYPAGSVPSGVTGYDSALLVPSTNAQDDCVTATPTQNDYYPSCSFLTPSGEPGVTALPAGTAYRYLWCKTSSGTAQIKTDLLQYKTTGNVATTGAITDVTFTASTRTIARAAGSFVTDGFTAGVRITVSGAAQAGNNDSWIVQSVAALSMVLAPGQTLTDEAAGASVTIVTKEKLLRSGASNTFTHTSFALMVVAYSDGNSHDLTDSQIAFRWWVRRTSAGASSNVTIATEGTGNASYIITTIPAFDPNVAHWMGEPTSANLRTALSDKTGTGLSVFGTAPTLSSPTIAGTPVITATSMSATGNARIKGYPALANIQTTDATVTTAYSFTPTDETTTLLVVSGLVIKSDGSASGAFVRRVKIDRDGGVVTVSTVEENWDDLAGAFSTCVLTVDSSGTSVRVRWTGVAGTTIDVGLVIDRWEMSHA